MPSTVAARRAGRVQHVQHADRFDQPHHRLAFFGFVRTYKGLVDLLQALAMVDARIELEVLGEFWEPIDEYRTLIDGLGLSGRVMLRPEYATREEVGALLRRCDALVLPYRSATGTQMPRVAFANGVPVIATDVGSLGEQVTHDVDGLVTRPQDAAALADAIDLLYRDGRWQRLRDGVVPPDADAEWASYLATVLDPPVSDDASRQVAALRHPPPADRGQRC